MRTALNSARKRIVDLLIKSCRSSAARGGARSAWHVYGTGSKATNLNYGSTRRWLCCIGTLAILPHRSDSAFVRPEHDDTVMLAADGCWPSLDSGCLDQYQHVSRFAPSLPTCFRIHVRIVSVQYKKSPTISSPVVMAKTSVKTAQAGPRNFDSSQCVIACSLLTRNWPRLSARV